MGNQSKVAKRLCWFYQKKKKKKTCVGNDEFRKRLWDIILMKREGKEERKWCKFMRSESVIYLW